MNYNFFNNKTNLTNEAIISKININYNDYYNFVQNTSDNLSKSQFKPGEKVAIFAERDESFLITFMALLQIGAIVVPINKKIPENQLLQMLSDINCSKLLTNEELISKTKDTSFKVFQISKFIPDKIIHTTTTRLKPISLEQESTIIFTSGSSGNQKAVLHTFGNHYYSAKGSNENISFKVGDRWLLSLPLFHVGGLSVLFRAILSGGAVVVPKENMDLIENIKEYNVTHISLVATQLTQLLENEDSIEPLKNLKAILIGGSYVPSKLIQKCIANKLPFFTTYGSTEMASQITTTKTDEKSEKLFSSGKLLKYRDIKITDGGEILVKGKTLFKGYIENDSIIDPFDSEGWFHSGDLGEIDTEGYLSVIGRRDSMFISGGENIYPEEIEKILLNMKEIENSLVIDIPDKRYGSRPVAFIKTKRNELVKSENIINHLSEHLPKFKIPDAFYRWPEKFDSFKPNRYEFKKFYDNQKFEEID